MKSNYILQKTDGSFCPKCYRKVDMLCNEVFKKGMPAFFICFDCRTIGQIGKGPVDREE